MSLKRLLIANRGEIAIRVARAAAELGIETVSIHSRDDARSLHVRRTDRAVALSGAGPRAYLDVREIIDAAVNAGCDAIHPGYGFLSESAAFARSVRKAELIFVGPRSEVLETFGDKTRARALAQRLDVPVLPGSPGSVTVEEARAFFASLGVGAQMLIKASAGGGGRGMRVIADEQTLAESYARARSEALAAFGDDAVYVERKLPRARHIEVQIIGDGKGSISHLWERECTLQRRHQKLIELAPSPSLPEALRDRLLSCALRMAIESRFDSLGTFEFLVDATADADAPFAFIEANARLQVEHTVTEAVLGIDLVKAQLQIAGGASLAELRLQQHEVPKPRGLAVQLRVNLETMQADGSAKPGAGPLLAFEPPCGPGVRVDTYGYSGYVVSANFDSLLAKVIVHADTSSVAQLAATAYRALCEFRIDGPATNIGFLQALLKHPCFVTQRIDTQFIDAHLPELTAAAAHPRLFVDTSSRTTLAGARIDTSDPLAVLNHGKQTASTAGGALPDVMPGMLIAPLQGTVVAIDVGEGDAVVKGQQVLVLESMKMEHVVNAPQAGVVRHIACAVGDAVIEGATLLTIEHTHASGAADELAEQVDLDRIRPDLAEANERHRRTLDAARGAAVEKRRATRQRTARENVDDLCDPGSFVEYGALVLAAQRARRSLEELIDKTPGDGMVTGVGRINGDKFDDPGSSAVVMAYDYTVLAGTQGTRNHAKTDRMLKIAQAQSLPVVLFTEGGGGRPGDTESSGDAGSSPTFGQFAELSGHVPLIGINSGRCFAGNASLLGCCDVTIATANSNIGMGGPAMIEGGGLGIFAPEEIGPMSVQLANGVVDIGVTDEAEAVRVARQYLSYFQGALPDFETPDQRRMRQLIPENRLRVYDVRRIVTTLSDAGWVLELRQDFARGMITSLIRVEGRSVGVVANNPQHLGGAIDSDGADKASRFMQLCDAHDIPILFLCDTPGIMVGPEAEKTALVRHSSRMFVVGANLTVPTFAIVLRKAYGLGALAMAGGSFKRTGFTVAWPTGEFGGMGLEGAAKLAYRNDLAKITDPAQRKRKYEEFVAKLYDHGKALSIATIFGVDDTIDPADSRKWLATHLRALPAPARRTGRKRMVDPW
jgi:acetyl/propionyl-CoA carboxylase alpha subunit